MRDANEPPNLDVTANQRQIGALESVAIDQFLSIRALQGSADSTFTFGARSTRPTSGFEGDRFLAVDRGVLYLFTGVSWMVIVGFFSGTNATRAGWTIDVTDNGSYFVSTDDPKALWEVVAGAWVNRNTDVSTTTAFKVGTTQVVNARKTGWGVPAGTLSRAAYTSYAGQTVSAGYVQAEVQAIDTAVRDLARVVAALLTDIHGGTSGHGLIGT